jgi:putative NADH-flavin reductase
MKLLIFGASGATGIHLVEQALTGGHEVTAFVRDERKLSISHPKLSQIQGNVGDAKSVQKAVAGQDAVFSALGAHRVYQFDPIVVNGLTYIINAMSDLKVKRLIYLSTMAVEATRGQAGFVIRALAPTLLRYEIRGHEIREKIIQDSSLQWTIVRAPILTNGRLTETYRTESNLHSKQFATKLSRADVAHCMLAQLNQGYFIKKAVCVTP